MRTSSALHFPWPTWERSETSSGRSGCTRRRQLALAGESPVRLPPGRRRYGSSFHLHRALLFPYNVAVGSSVLLDPKFAQLRRALATSGRLLVAYSGGVDSAFLAWVAHEVLGSE